MFGYDHEFITRDSTTGTVLQLDQAPASEWHKTRSSVLFNHPFCLHSFVNNDPNIPTKAINYTDGTEVCEC